MSWKGGADPSRRPVASPHASTAPGPCVVGDGVNSIIKGFLLVTTGVDPHRTLYTQCPICRSSEIVSVLDQDWTSHPAYLDSLFPVIRWMNCGACGHEFTSGYYNEEGEALRLRFARPDQTPEGLTGSVAEAPRQLWSKVIDVVSSLQPTGRWLDVGAGAGMLSAAAGECGYSVAAMEIRPQVADAIRELGIEVIPGGPDNDSAVGPQTIDVLSFCDLLEHLPFPLVGLEFATRALRPGGVLFISCPNRDALAWKLLRQEGINPYFSESEHYHNFSFNQLRSLLIEFGFGSITCSISNRYRLCVDVVARYEGLE